MLDSTQPTNARVLVMCYTCVMASKARKPISERQWQAAADAYELGIKHASQIARELGVSSSTVSRVFKLRGCIKACRVAESVAALEAALDAKDRRLAPQHRAEEAAAAKRLSEIDRMIDQMVRSIVAAEKAGKLSAATGAIEEVARSLGLRLAR